MSLMQTAAQIWRDFVTDGVPSSGRAKPKKADIRAWGTRIETFVQSLGANAAVYLTRSELYGDLSRPDKTLAWVMQDPTVVYNGIYQKNGGPGAGAWTRVADLPYSFIVATDTGDGTPNEIEAVSSLPISQSALVWMTVGEPNTTTTVTVSFNGDTPLHIKTNSGNDPEPGGLVGTIMGIKDGSLFRLVSDQASAAVLASAEAAVDLAEAWAQGIAPGGPGTYSSKQWADQGVAARDDTLASEGRAQDLVDAAQAAFTGFPNGTVFDEGYEGPYDGPTYFNTDEGYE